MFENSDAVKQNYCYQGQYEEWLRTRWLCGLVTLGIMTWRLLAIEICTIQRD